MPRKSNTTKKTSVKKAETAAKPAEKETVKAEAVKTDAVKKEAPAEKKAETAAKPAAAAKAKSAKPAAKKSAAKKPAAAKKSERVQEIFLEIQGNQIETNDIVKKIEEAYKAEGHQIGRIKDLKVYVNYDENRAYYVINGNPEDKFVEL